MPGRRVGRYVMYEAFASGGMASIHFGRRSGDAGFARLVAMKRLHPQFGKDAEFVAMFTDEARVSARVQHPNVVGVHDVVKDGEELVLVMDYVDGAPLSRLVTAARDRGEKVPPRIAAGIVAQALNGLHAAHEARGEGGKPLQIVHRDVSPQNILVGADGVARVVDFGVAKALGRSQHTAEGNYKGKIRYFAPEQLTNDVDRRTDVFAASVVLWETLRAERLFRGETQWEVIQSVLSTEIPSPSEEDPLVPEELSRVLMKGLARERTERWPTARAMAVAIERACSAASTGEIAEWMEALAGDELASRRARVEAIEGIEDAPPASAKSGTAAVGVVTGEVASGVGARTADVRSPVESTTLATPRRFPTVAVVGIVVGVGGLAFGLGSALRSGESAAPRTVVETRATPAPTEGPSLVVSIPAPTGSATPDSPAPSALVVASASAAPSSSSRASPPPKSVPTGTSPSATRNACASDDDCTSGFVCESGVCTCPGAVCGDGVCHDTYRELNNCGGCGKVCKSGEYCVSGCIPCAAGRRLDCGGRCIDVSSDDLNCGACGKQCAHTEHCMMRECVKY